MWIKLEIIPDNEKFIIVSPCFAKKLKRKCNVIFGGRKARIKVKSTDDLEFHENSEFSNPITIMFTGELKEHLLIPETLIYQAKIERNNIIIGPVIGFLLGIHNHDYSLGHMKKYSDRLGIYNKVGGLICAFSSVSIDWEKRTVYGLYYNSKNYKWEYGIFPLPNVIYRRDFHQSQEIIDKLLTATNGRLFNSYRFTKLELMSTFPTIWNFLPVYPQQKLRTPGSR